MVQSLKSIKIDGVISIIGFLGGGADSGRPPRIIYHMFALSREFMWGSRVQLEDVVSLIFVWL